MGISCNFTFYLRLEVKKDEKGECSKIDEEDKLRDENNRLKEEILYLKGLLNIPSLTQTTSPQSDLTQTKSDVENYISRKMRCELCSKSFSTSSEIQQHVLVHLNCFKCDSCDKAYSYKTDLYKHIRSCHKKLTWLCNVCKTSFYSNWALKRHELCCDGD